MGILSRISIAIRKPIIKLVKLPIPITYIGAGKAAKTGEILALMNIEKVFVITDKQLMKIRLLDTVIESIKSSGIEIIIFDEVLPEPSFGIVDKAVSVYSDCQAIIAVGGGSVLDTAKAAGAAIVSNRPAEKLKGLFKVKKKLPFFIAVPTTAGTGSEGTAAAVISESSTHEKMQILDPKLIPDVAILDPELTLGLPEKITINTTIDALTHALEAYVSGYADEETDRYSLIAINLIFRNLEIVMKNPTDAKAREALLTASLYAGLAFTRSYIGYVHAFAHTIGGRYGVPHGLANAVLLPHVMKYYMPVCKNRFAELAESIDICEAGDTTQVKGKKLVQKLFDINKQFGVPDRFEKFPQSDIEKVIDKAFKECHGVYPVPKYYSRETARKLLLNVCSDSIR